MIENRRTIYITIGAALLSLALTAVLITATVMVRRQSRDLAVLSETVKTELADASEDITSVKENLILLTRDTGDIRQVLRLPPISYPILDAEEDWEGENGGTNLVFFQSVDLLLARYRAIENASFFQTALNSRTVVSFLASRDMLLDFDSELTATIRRNGEVYFSIDFLPVEKQFSLTTATGASFNAANADELVRLLGTMYPQIENHLLEYKEALIRVNQLDEEPALTNIFQQRGLTLSPASDGAGTGSFRLLHGTFPVLSIGVDRETLSYSIENTLFTDYAGFITALSEKIQNLDMRTETEKRIDRQKSILQGLKNDGGFQLLLENDDLRIADNFREDSDYFYLDITGQDGLLVGAFAIQKLVGEIYLTDSEDIPISALKTLGLTASESGEKKN